jgi:hypothetical protein
MMCPQGARLLTSSPRESTMKARNAASSSRGAVALAATMMLLISGNFVGSRTGWAVEPESTYQIQSIVQSGDTVAGIKLKGTDTIWLGALNDKGQRVFHVDRGNNNSALLIQYADDKFTQIIVPGGDAPGGKWPKTIGIYGPAGMNHAGNTVFNAPVTLGDKTGIGTFLWDYSKQQVRAVALPGTPAVNDLTFLGSEWDLITINNSDETAFPAYVSSQSGQPQTGAFFRGRDGELKALALPDDTLPGGGSVLEALAGSLNDAGVVGFTARRKGQGEYRFDGYLWEKGTITPLVLAGSIAPDGRRIVSVSDHPRVNNKNRRVLIHARLSAATGPQGVYALYDWSDGVLTPVAVPGQPMPDGSRLKSACWSLAVSQANEAGEHAFVAQLEGGGTAAYLLDPGGKLTLILKSGMKTDLGVIQKIGWEFEGGVPIGIGLNSQGQVALGVKIVGGPSALVLLTPPAPASSP